MTADVNPRPVGRNDAKTRAGTCLGCADHFFSPRRAYPHLWVTLATFAAATERVVLTLSRSPTTFPLARRVHPGRRADARRCPAAVSRPASAQGGNGGSRRPPASTTRRAGRRAERYAEAAHDRAPTSRQRHVSVPRRGPRRRHSRNRPASDASASVRRVLGGPRRSATSGRSSTGSSCS